MPGVVTEGMGRPSRVKMERMGWGASSVGTCAGDLAFSWVKNVMLGKICYKIFRSYYLTIT